MKILTAVLFGLCAVGSAQNTTIKTGELVLSVTSSNTAVLSVQLQKKDSLSDGEWKDVGNPVRWEVPIEETGFFRVQTRSGEEMKTYTPTNTANLPQAILWQYENAERLKALILNQQKFFEDSTTAFWNDYRDNVFSLNPWRAVAVANSFEPEFNGTYVFDSTLLKWVNGDFTIYKNIIWYMTGNGKTYTAPDNGLNIPPATFVRKNIISFPTIITVVGAGTSAANGDYSGSYPIFVKGSYSVRSVNFEWFISKLNGFRPGNSNLYSGGYSVLPRKTGWSVLTGTSPAPTIEYSLEQYFSATVSPAGASPFCLSMWGAILGLPRPSYLVGGTPTPFSDAMYSRLLWARMLNLQMNGSMKDINRYMNILFSGKPVSVVDNFNMTISYYFSYTLTAEEEALIAIDGILPRPAGVEAILGEPPPESTVFGFSGQNLGQFDRSSFAPETA